MSDPRHFVKVYNPKSGKYPKFNTMQQVTDFIASLPVEDQGAAIWYSIKNALNTGRELGYQRGFEDATTLNKGEKDNER